MKVETNHIDELNAELTLVIEKTDYEVDYNKQLKDYQKKAQLKGFRKGKVPVSVVKKMYGGAILQESVSKILTDKINDLITGDDFNIIGEPFLIDRENLPELDHKALADYTYKFELGLEPEFSVLGVTDNDKYIRREIEISDSMIDDEVESLLKRLGEQKSVEGKIEKDDVVYFHSKELYNGKILVDGYDSEFSCGFDKINEPYASELLKLAKNDTIDVDIYQLEKDLPANQVEKYLLKIKEDTDLSGVGNDFRLEIVDIVRVTKAELDQETFDKSFGKDEVKSEEEARGKIKEFLSEHFQKEADNLVNREIMETLMTVNSIQLPTSFLKKWMGQSREQEMTDEQFESFQKELKWRIIKKKLVKRFEVEVKEEEIFKHFVNAIRGYSPYMDDESLKNTAFSLMNNKEQVNTAVEGISSGKLFDAVREVVNIENKPIDKEGFYEIAKSLNQKAG